ncbi:DNA-3-methyladenine glycosylase [Rhodococcus tibetensis]|uniref:Putative 3-methyladenine DNA glycosylase n=1 Tax=Rhodococcus tibetensis TaxID=2965064 RepID=A0ABT1QAA0_9NOCA|nr:DNA-3-methyladenine glycosylase [Rhodococcus sp. FXJ9.536]MCQ4119194.1 DNA-3-methyladenine glycosylase [Rhodococcus sp. FXJ9.536]
MTVDRLAEAEPTEAAKIVLGSTLIVEDVRLRIVEVEAYGGEEEGPWPDPASHSYRGRTLRNAVMFGPAGHLYVYRSYGMHYCMNVSYGPVGTAGGVLLRAGEVLGGDETVRVRRSRVTRPADFARGPGNLGSATGVTLADNGAPLFAADSPIRLEIAESEGWVSGPRVGVSAAADRPWRFWIPESAAVSVYRRSPRAMAAEERMG